MRIVDAQVHLWASGAPSGHHRQVPAFTASELLTGMAAAGVDAAVIHPPSWDPGGNEVAVAAVRAHPGRFAILGQFPPDAPESRAAIEHWQDRPGMRGLRWALTLPHQRAWVEDGTMDWVWPAAERLGLPVATLAWRFLPAFAAIAERHPRLRLIIDHVGWVRPAQDAAALETMPALLEIARRCPNVAVKATGAPAYSTEAYPFRNLHDPLHRLFDAFGPDRFFWGTDITRMPCSYRQCVRLFTEELPWLAGPELAKVMGQGVCDWIGWTAGD